MVELTLPIVLTAAALDSINPCAIGVLVLLLTYFQLLKARAKILITSIVYISVVYISYTLIGLGVISAMLAGGLTVPFYYTVAAIAIGAGVLEIKDFLWYGRWFSLTIPSRALEYMEGVARKATIPIAAGLGVLVMAIEFPCTGAPYLAILGLLATTTTFWAGFQWLLLYNIVFVAPLVLISTLYYYGTTVHALERWRRKYRRWVRLLLGLFLVSLGLWMLWAVV